MKRRQATESKKFSLTIPDSALYRASEAEIVFFHGDWSARSMNMDSSVWPMNSYQKVFYIKSEENDNKRFGKEFTLKIS